MLTALCSLAAALAPQDTTPHSSTALLTSVTSFAPGKSFLMGFQIKMEKGWHCYWKNPGDSGEPTSITPKVPSGWKIEPLAWPTPKRFRTGSLVSYGYEGSPIFVYRITPPKEAKSGTIGFDAEWLICADMCLSASDSVRRTLPAAAVAKASPSAQALNSAIANTARPRREWTATAVRKGGTITLSLAGRGLPAKGDGAYFFSAEAGVLDHAKHQPFSVAGGRLSGALPVSSFANKPPARLSGVLVIPNLTPTLIDVAINGDK